MQTIFGQTIRKQRLACDIRLRGLAKTIGVTPSYLSQIERGTALPPAEHVIKKIALQLNIDFFTLMRLANKMPSELHEKVMDHFPLISRMIMLAADMSQYEVEDIIESMLEKSNAPF